MKKYIDDQLKEELNQIHASKELKNRVLDYAKNIDTINSKVKKRINYRKAGSFVSAAVIMCILFNSWLINTFQDPNMNTDSTLSDNGQIKYTRDLSEDAREKAIVAGKGDDTDTKANTNKKKSKAQVESMNKVKTNKKLVKLLNKSFDSSLYNGRLRAEATLGGTADAVLNTDMATGESAVNAPSTSTETEKQLQDDTGFSGDYSETNVQVQGVDESDIVKTDGKYIYYVNRSSNQICIVDAKNNKSLKIAGKIDFNNQDIYVNEIYLHNNKLIAILNESSYGAVDLLGRKVATEEIAVDSDSSWDYYTHNSMVVANVYNISDLSNIELERTVKIEGNYTSSRKVGNNVYLISNKYISYFRELTKDDAPSILPIYEDSARKKNTITIKPSKILYTPEMESTVYVIIAGFNVDEKDENANITTILGNAQSVYASSENLYLTANVYTSDDLYTNIYSFALNNGTITQKATGQVKGTLLNQYSMDEYNGYFRLATTSNDQVIQAVPFKGSETSTSNTSTAADEPVADIAPDTNVAIAPAFPSFTLYNHVYILNDNLEQVGLLKDLAKDERIYSTRFFGDKLYMVTFKTVDPLFVIDLSVPTNPKILGELKIPGYSNYLHMYDENHVIGIGQDTKSYVDEYGERTVNLGIKASLFDVSDVNNPVVKDEIILGGQGSYTNAAYDFKSVLFSKEKNLLAFPATITEKGYGDLQFEGALVFNISLEKGLEERGRITHQPNSNSFLGDNYINRILYIGDALFTLSNNKVQSSNINNCQTIDLISIK